MNRQHHGTFFNIAAYRTEAQAIIDKWERGETSSIRQAVVQAHRMIALLARTAELESAIRAAEWGEFGADYCPFCHCLESVGHAAGCIVRTLAPAQCPDCLDTGISGERASDGAPLVCTACQGPDGPKVRRPDPSKCDHDVTCARCGTRWPPTGGAR